MPPEGRSLRLINIVDWGSEKGPGVEQYSVEPTRAADAVRDNLARTLRDINLNL